MLRVFVACYSVNGALMW